jgi:outer membrane scaffolding protein for murein synthesis (MipA/OmpV family)
MSACVAFLCGSALAQESKPLWEYGLSGFGIRAPAYIGSDQSKSRAAVLPWFIYRGEVFRADGDTLGARVVKRERLEFDVGFGAALGASSEDVTARAGMPSLGFQFEFGPRAKFLLARPDADSTLRLAVPYRAVLEFTDGLQHRGMVLEPELKYAVRSGAVRWQAGVSVVLADQRYGNFLYGVPVAYATATRPAFHGKAGLITKRLDGNVRMPINKDFSAFAFYRYDSASGAANAASPLFKKSSGSSIGGGLVWTIGRSSTNVAD